MYIILLIIIIIFIIFSKKKINSYVDVNNELTYIINRSRNEIGYILKKRNFKIGMEIGVQKAKFSEKLLQIWTNCKEYTMIDPWMKQKYYDDGANVDMRKQNQRFIDAMMVVEKYSSTVIFKIFKTKSEMVYKSFNIETYDFIYIDARHDYYSVKNDINNYYPILKSGGILGGDDYAYSPGRWKMFPDGTIDKYNRSVKGAVDEFVRSKKLHLFLSKDRSWFIVKLK